MRRRLLLLRNRGRTRNQTKPTKLRRLGRRTNSKSHSLKLIAVMRAVSLWKGQKAILLSKFHYKNNMFTKLKISLPMIEIKNLGHKVWGKKQDKVSKSPSRSVKMEAQSKKAHRLRRWIQIKNFRSFTMNQSKCPKKLLTAAIKFLVMTPNRWCNLPPKNPRRIRTPNRTTPLMTKQAEYLLFKIVAVNMLATRFQATTAKITQSWMSSKINKIKLIATMIKLRSNFNHKNKSNYKMTLGHRSTQIPILR